MNPVCCERAWLLVSNMQWAYNSLNASRRPCMQQMFPAVSLSTHSLLAHMRLVFSWPACTPDRQTDTSGNTSTARKTGDRVKAFLRRLPPVWTRFIYIYRSRWRFICFVFHSWLRRVLFTARTCVLCPRPTLICGNGGGRGHQNKTSGSIVVVVQRRRPGGRMRTNRAGIESSPQATSHTFVQFAGT